MSDRVHFRSPQTVIGRFVARRTVRGAGFLAIIFGVYVASKAAGLAAIYPTAAGREAAMAALGSNIGLVAILGRLPNVLTVASGAVWNTLPVMAMIGAIWALLLATRSLRGEEDAGRWELMLSGQTSPRLAVANTLLGLAASLVILYLVTAITFIGVGKIHGVDFNVPGAFFFALAAVCGAAMFMSVGALASQVMPTRARASGLALSLFGICFLIRAVGDVTKMSWLSDLSPFGWIINLRPLYQASPQWLVPMATLIVFCVALTIFLAGRRDLGDSLFADRDTAKAHVGLLRGPLTVAIRLTRASNIGWLLAVVVLATAFGSLTKAAAQAFEGSQAAIQVVSKVVHATNFGATAYLGFEFFLLMTLVMCYAASAVGRMREEEAEGYLDNLFVRSVGRMRWLWGRIVLIVTFIIIAGLLSAVAVWLSMAGQNNGVTFHALLLAGLNTIAPAVLTLGVGIAAMALLPRLTTVIAYSVVGWSFLLELVASGLNLNHWVLDTSVFYHVALAPATDPVWRTSWALIGIGVALCIIGAFVFNRRDLAGN